VTNTLPISFDTRAVVVPGADALVVADVHLGRGAASSVDAPISDTDRRRRLEGLLERHTPETVVIAGDLLHAFDRIPRGVEPALEELDGVVERAGASLVVTPGNHDSMLESIYQGPTPEAYRLTDGETVVCHGHERPTLEADRYVIGHDHPAIDLEGRKLPCFLYGPAAYEGADVVMLPAFTSLAAGMTVNRMRGSDFQSPLVRDIDGFHPGVWDDERGGMLWFPPLGECRSLL